MQKKAEVAAPAIPRPDAHEPPGVVGLVHVDTEGVDAVLVLDVDEVGCSVTVRPSGRKSTYLHC